MDLNQARELAVKLKTSGKEPQAIVDALDAKGFTFKKGAPITTKTLGPLYRQRKNAGATKVSASTVDTGKAPRRMNQAKAASVKSSAKTVDSSIVKSVLQDTNLSPEHRIQIALKFL